jgi:hypothetical protein
MVGIPNDSDAQFTHDFNDGELRGKYSILIGTNTFAGYTLGMEYSLGVKHNNFTAGILMHSEVGKNTSGFITPVFYNDKFYEFNLMYGRSFQKNRLFFGVDLGPSFFIYKDKSLGTSSGYLTTNESTSETQKSIGLHVKSSLDLFVSRNSSLGIQLGVNLNSYQLMVYSALRYSVLFK